MTDGLVDVLRDAQQRFDLELVTLTRKPEPVTAANWIKSVEAGKVGVMSGDGIVAVLGKSLDDLLGSDYCLTAKHEDHGYLRFFRGSVERGGRVGPLKVIKGKAVPLPPSLGWTWQQGPGRPGTAIEDLPDGLVPHAEPVAEPEIVGRKVTNFDPGQHVQIGPDLMSMTDIAVSLIRDEWGADSDRPVFVRGCTLVELGHKQLGVEIHMALESGLRERLSRSRVWLDTEGRSMLPPGEVVRSLVSRKKYPGLPEILGFHPAPMVRPNGDVALTPGYDREARLWLDFDPDEYQGCGSFSSDSEAAEAALEPFQDFPMPSDTDRASLLALLLTLAGRNLIAGSVPMFGVTAPTTRTGKGKLVSAASLLCHGREVPIGFQAESDQEMRKLLVSIALKGSPFALFDNIDKAGFGMASLAAAITSPGAITDRVLGESRMVDVPWRTVLAVTGNNMLFRGDLRPRTVLIELDSGMEHPEDRDPLSFTYPDLLGHLRAHRAPIYMALIHLLRNHVLQGYPREVGRGFGGFEDWDRVVRQLVIRVMHADPLNRDREEDDGDVAQIRALMWVWGETIGEGKWVTCGDLAATENAYLERALMDFTDAKDAVNAHRLGVRLRTIAKRPVSGRRFISRMGRRKTKEWALMPCGADPVQFADVRKKAADA